MAAAVRDPPEFLDVNVRQLPWAVVLVTADHTARGPIQPRQPDQPEPGQNPVHRGGTESQQKADPGRAPQAIESDRDDPPLPPHGRAVQGVEDRLERSTMLCSPWIR